MLPEFLLCSGICEGQDPTTTTLIFKEIKGIFVLSLMPERK